MKQPFDTWNVLVKLEKEGECLMHSFKLTSLGQPELCISFSISGSFLNKFIWTRLINQVKPCMCSIIAIAQLFASFSRDGKL